LCAGLEKGTGEEEGHGTMAKLKHLIMRFLMRTVGQTSKGIRIASTDGFTSGVMLEYIYRNQPEGNFVIGKWIDRSYLSHPGWQVIRTRKANLETLLAKAVAEQHGIGRNPAILDVASGPAQYVLDVIATTNVDAVCAVCRDMEQRALDQGRANAGKRGLQQQVQFCEGDALSAESLAEVKPKPNIVVSSGFYDWITDDELVKESIALIHDLLPDNGNFIFTNQTGHFDMEMVQAVFVDFRGEPLRMTTRSVETVNGWARDCGFDILETLSDNNGHYAVTLTRKK